VKKTAVLKIDPERPDKHIIAKAASMIRRGMLVAFPTETVYGIAANRLDKKAMISLSRIKKRPKSKPFTVHVSRLRMLKKLDCPLTVQAKALVEKFWPGPLTIILRSKNGEKMGFRMPANKIALQLIDKAGVPVVAPSANLRGHASPVSAEDVLQELDGKIDILLDAGDTDIGVESTVADLTVNPPRVLREGAISREKIEKELHRNNRVGKYDRNKMK